MDIQDAIDTVNAYLDQFGTTPSDSTDILNALCSKGVQHLQMLNPQLKVGMEELQLC